MVDTGRASMNSSFSGRGQHVIIDKDGVHVRQVPQAPVESSSFMGVVLESWPTEGYVIVQKAVGTMGALRPKDVTSPRFKVWVGYNTFLRGPAGNYYDEVFCIENPVEESRGTYPYIGFANLPAFGYVEPDTGYSVDQDNPPPVSGAM